MNKILENPNYEELNKLAAEFLGQLPTCKSLESLDAGFKCFTIAYLSADLKTDAERFMSIGLFEYVSKKHSEKEFSMFCLLL